MLCQKADKQPQPARARGSKIKKESPFWKNPGFDEKGFRIFTEKTKKIDFEWVKAKIKPTSQIPLLHE